LQAISDKVQEKEQKLTPEEEAMNLTTMEFLNLGDHQNYKTKLV
tara:strand:- start:373 stop:504 length:132 start_codon:yes stop_codon:yes gene_type:complete